MTALIAWPNFHREMDQRSTNRWQHRPQTRTPNLHRANKIAHQECGWKGGDSGGSAGRKKLVQRKNKRTHLTPAGLLMEGDYTNYAPGPPLAGL